MNKINCAVIDDEPLALELMELYINQTPFLNLVRSCSNSAELLQCLKTEKVDLVFMDIHMPDISGLELSKYVDDAMVIFVTAHDRYALESYKVNAVDYLLKPINYAEFMKAANNAFKLYELKRNAVINSNNSEDGGSIFIKSDYKLVQINFNSILYVEGLKDYIKIYIDGESNPIVSLISMKSVEEALPKNTFMRVHRSYIINMSKVTVVDRSRVLFGKVYIPVSDTYKDAFNSYIEERILR